MAFYFPQLCTLTDNPDIAYSVSVTHVDNTRWQFKVLISLACLSAGWDTSFKSSYQLCFHVVSHLQRFSVGFCFQ